MSKKILLTGGTGFLGSFITKRLVEAGYEVTVLKRTTSNTERISNLLEGKIIDSLDVDIDDIDSLFRERAFDVVIHTATSIGRNAETMEQVKAVNYDLPMRLLNLAMQVKSEAFLNADTFYELDGKPDQKDRAYILTKKDFLKDATKIVFRSEKIKFINLRIEHMYGPNDSEHKFVPFLMRSLRAGTKIDFTEGLNERDFVYVEDVAEGFLATLNHLGELGQVVEFGMGTGKTHTIRDFTNLFQEEMDVHETINWGVRPYPPGDNMYSKANLKNNNKIDWKATHSLEEGVRKTIEAFEQ